MTLETFLEKLEQTPRDWELYLGDCIVRPVLQCPVSTLCGLQGSDYDKAANQLGMDMFLADEIVNAADNFPGHNPKLRAKLLKACGLEAA